MTSIVLAIWLLAICYVAVFYPQRLLALAIVSAVFDGASLLKVGGFAISPYYFTLLTIAARCVFVKTDASHLLGSTRRVRTIMISALVFAGIALAGAFILPIVFAGWGVYSARLDDSAATPLAFTASNLGQSAYLVLNIVFFWYVAQTASSKTLQNDATKAVLLAGAIVIAFGLYQLVASLTGLPFPDDILFSNDTYVVQYGTMVSDMPRVCSTFNEPAGLAVFLVGFTAFITTDTVGITCKPILRFVLLIGAIAVLILSTSSTAYIGFAVIALWRIGTYILLPILKGTWSGRRIAWMLAFLAAMGALIASNQTLQATIQTAVFEKNQTASFDERSQGDALSTQLIFSTYGLGVGLGSNRSSSFITSFLSTVGVLGAGAFAVMVFFLVRKSDTSALLPAQHMELASGVLGILCAKAISQPDLSSPGLWAMMAGLLAIHGTAKAAATATTPLADPLSRFGILGGAPLTGTN